MYRLSILVLLAVLSLPLTAEAGTVCTYVGNQVFCTSTPTVGSGTGTVTCTRIGNQLFCS